MSCAALVYIIVCEMPALLGSGIPWAAQADLFVRSRLLFFFPSLFLLTGTRSPRPIFGTAPTNTRSLHLGGTLLHSPLLKWSLSIKSPIVTKNSIPCMVARGPLSIRRYYKKNIFLSIVHTVKEANVRNAKTGARISFVLDKRIVDPAALSYPIVGCVCIFTTKGICT
ncbi:hypothetical protein BJV82DRAFT_589783 [Fennellomyces sp. T-0311]|nr:hypothetical protein BJV82DRAFT_589783 [Fennellomyces sp. T-0311]